MAYSNTKCRRSGIEGGAEGTGATSLMLILEWGAILFERGVSDDLSPRGARTLYQGERALSYSLKEHKGEPPRRARIPC